MKTAFKLIALFAALALSKAANAHDLVVSEVRIHQQGSSLEVWQTSPEDIAHSFVDIDRFIIPDDADADYTPSRDQFDDAALLEIANGWRVYSETGASCKLERQARKRVHHDMDIYMRYLFVCADDKAPKKFVMHWLNQMEKPHLVYLFMDKGHGERTYFVQPPNIEYELPTK